MRKIEIITEIINVFDENKELKILLEKQNENKCVVAAEKGSEPKKIDKEIYETGRKKLFEDCTYHQFNRVNAKWDEDDNKIIGITLYSRWKDNKVKINQIPSNISLNDFLEEFEEDLKIMYEKEKNETIQELKRENE